MSSKRLNKIRNIIAEYEQLWQMEEEQVVEVLRDNFRIEASLDEVMRQFQSLSLERSSQAPQYNPSDNAYGDPMDRFMNEQDDLAGRLLSGGEDWDYYNQGEASSSSPQSSRTKSQKKEKSKSSASKSKDKKRK